MIDVMNEQSGFEAVRSASSEDASGSTTERAHVGAAARSTGFPAQTRPPAMPPLTGLRPASRSKTDCDTPESENVGGRISRTIVNFWLDSALLAVLVALGATAVIVQFIFPPGVAARGWTLWGLTYGQWTSIQFAELSVLGIGVLVHVMLHWTWVCSVITRRILRMKELPDDGIRTIYGVGFLILLLLVSGAVVAAAMLTIRSPEL